MYKALIFSIFCLAGACTNSPRVIESEPVNGSGTEAPAGGAPGAAPANPTGMPSVGGADEMHTVTALETLNTERYTYVRVQENGQEHWVAIPKGEVKIGATYSYRGGLMKKDFLSKEHNRTFETLYLVPGLMAAGATDPHAGHNHAPGEGHASGEMDMSPPKSVTRAAGAIAIGDLVKNKAKYAGKTVKITGKVMKVNNMIMNRNWLHLQDGTGNNFDLVITSTESVPPGHTVTLEGTVTLDKDFGAGYKYDLIVENGVLVK
jgi:GW (Gly-Tryp) dipeptide domain